MGKSMILCGKRNLRVSQTLVLRYALEKRVLWSNLFEKHSSQIHVLREHVLVHVLRDRKCTLAYQRLKSHAVKKPTRQAWLNSVFPTRLTSISYLLSP